MSTLPSVLLINYIHLLLARCSRTFISNAVLPVYFSHVQYVSLLHVSLKKCVFNVRRLQRHLHYGRSAALFVDKNIYLVLGCFCMSFTDMASFSKTGCQSLTLDLNVCSSFISTIHTVPFHCHHSQAISLLQMNILCSCFLLLLYPCLVFVWSCRGCNKCFKLNTPIG